MSRSLLVAVGIAGTISVSAVGASSAAAEPSLTLTTAADPAESITTQIIAKGTSNNNNTRLTITLKATGGQGCAANPAADSGSSLIEPPSVEEAIFSRSFNHEFTSAGTYLLCGWLNDAAQTGSPVVATASLTFAVRPPHLALAISAPATVAVGQTFQVVTTAQAEVRRSVNAYVLPDTGRGCPANASAASTTSGESILDFPAQGFSSAWALVGGPFSESVNESFRSAGQYLICGYIQYPSSQSPPEITASASIAAISPPPPCVVPSYSSATRLRDAERVIRASGCAVGRVRKVASRRVRAGYVIGLNATPGTHLAAGAPLSITVSTGPPCVVPFVPAGITLGRTELRLLVNHCAVGKISSTRSRRTRRGRVLRLGARTGQVLPSHAPVAIVVARRGR